MPNQPATDQPRLTRLFFHESDARLLERLRAELHQDERRVALAHALGNDNPELLDELVALEVRAETLAAFRLVPLITVAWSNNIIYGEERQRILDMAAERNIRDGSPAYGLLREWLVRQPPPELFDAWKEYVRTLCGSLSPRAGKTLREQVLHASERVARAAGGVLGLGTIDQRESEVLGELRSAFAT